MVEEGLLVFHHTMPLLCNESVAFYDKLHLFGHGLTLMWRKVVEFDDGQPQLHRTMPLLCNESVVLYDKLPLFGHGLPLMWQKVVKFDAGQPHPIRNTYCFRMDRNRGPCG